MRKCLFSVILIPLLSLLSACSLNDSFNNRAYCENHFFLTSDFKKKYEKEGDYFEFLSKDSYLDTYYYKNDDGFNCHYYLKYNDGTVVDSWGVYVISGRLLNITINDDEKITFEFSYYGSKTIDYILITTLEYNNNIYHLIYEARYFYSSKG